MIDTHTHFLPGLDDGPATLEESLALIRAAAANGITAMVATPHANHQYEFDAGRTAAALAEVRAASDAGVALYSGCEVHLSAQNIERVLRDPRPYAMNQAGYLLVEFSDFAIPPAASDIFTRLMDAGVRPVIAHPERNALLRADTARLRAWVAQGAVLQITASSLFERFGKAARASSIELLRLGLVQLVSSDAHDTVHRPPELAEAREFVNRRFGDEMAEELFVRNPAAVVAGDHIGPPPAPRPRRRWLPFWS
ncbi:MAG TPA: CpsB/CapC family capsule biosynthesis tyrosine phosphatase [Beijerinckiaceae bacterium]|nr:CpsB/CapC family capsule biosynthesis tyrosine phosphatase [Beijerinckiaceae bacterium]